MPSTEVTIERAGDSLRFSGALLRTGCAAAWVQALPLLGGIRRFDLAAVPRVDSAGIALLAELAARAGGAITLEGDPEGLQALCAAYRLTPTLAYA